MPPAHVLQALASALRSCLAGSRNVTLRCRSLYASLSVGRGCTFAALSSGALSPGRLPVLPDSLTAERIGIKGAPILCRLACADIRQP